MRFKASISAIMAGLVLVAITIPDSSDAWLLYQKPPFMGKVLDTETKKPIEGAVVEAVYIKRVIGVVSSGYEEVEVKEVLTDSNGIFNIPEYTTLINPLNSVSYVKFEIYKRGYGRFFINKDIQLHMSRSDEEIFFNKHDFGKDKELEFILGKKEGGFDFRTIKITFGIVELQRLNTIEERIRIISGLMLVDSFLEKEPNLIKMINEEQEYLDIPKTDPFKAREYMRNMDRTSPRNVSPR